MQRQNSILEDMGGSKTQKRATAANIVEMVVGIRDPESARVLSLVLIRVPNQCTFRLQIF